MKRALVIGASGTVGQSVVQRLLESGTGWDVVAVSRRTPEVASTRAFTHVSVDLQNREATAESLASLGSISHVMYTAVSVDRTAGHGDLQTNLAMLRNVIDPLKETRALRHVSILQGAKAYGVHLGPIPNPSREDLPRHPHENWYWLQEDYLKDCSERYGWSWTVLRPHLVCGGAVGVQGNLVAAIGAYAAICNQLGLGFGFPGGRVALWEATDARIVAGALEWAALSPRAAGEIFNVTNGEPFAWRDLWPQLANFLGVPAVDDTRRALAEFLPDHADTWAQIVTKHGLRPLTLSQVVGQSAHLADWVFNAADTDEQAPAFESAVKIRNAGYTELMRTDHMFEFWLNDLARRKILPLP